MEKLRDILITDRTQADVSRAEYLQSLFDRSGVWRGSMAELQELEASKGLYTPADLNRVLRACSWLAGRLEGYGYAVPGTYFPAALIHVSVRPPGCGRAESVLAYRGETVTVQAAGNKGYAFSHWEENGETASEQNAYRFTAEGDRELTAVFEVPPAEASGVVGLAAAGRAIVGKAVG